MSELPKHGAPSQEWAQSFGGGQRYWCRACGRKYTPDPTPQGYDEETRDRAVRLYVDGMNLRCQGRASSAWCIRP